jgi:hypothetical protein
VIQGDVFQGFSRPGGGGVHREQILQALHQMSRSLEIGFFVQQALHSFGLPLRFQAGGTNSQVGFHFGFKWTKKAADDAVYLRHLHNNVADAPSRAAIRQ